MKDSAYKDLVTRILKTSLPNVGYAGSISYVVAVSGAAALGKTEFCKKLKGYFEEKNYSTIHIELDGYLKSRKERVSEKISGYDPNATRFTNLINDLSQLLKGGKPTNIPYYDHKLGKITKTIKAIPQAVVILDGIVALHYEIRNNFPGYNIFLSADDITMKGFRIDVDINERRYNIFDALRHIESESKEYDRWIHHQSEFADARISVLKNRNKRIRFNKKTSN